MNTPELFIVGTFVTALVSAAVGLPIFGAILDRRVGRAGEGGARQASDDAGTVRSVNATLRPNTTGSPGPPNPAVGTQRFRAQRAGAATNRELNER